MYKGIIIIVIIIVIIVLLNCITQNYTKETIVILKENLNKMRSDFLEEEINEDKIRQDIENTVNEWNKRYEILAYYIEHDELEKVENDLTMIKSNIDAKEYGEGVEHIDSCVFLINHIGDKEAVNIRNIF